MIPVSPLIYTHLGVALLSAWGMYYWQDLKADRRVAEEQAVAARITAKQEKINADTISDFHTALRALDDYRSKHPVVVRVPVSVCKDPVPGGAEGISIDPEDVLLTVGGTATGVR